MTPLSRILGRGLGASSSLSGSVTESDKAGKGGTIIKTVDTIRIDGAMGEGGGQIIRTAVALAAITGKPTEIVNIRAGRSKPGLQAQHLTSVKAAGLLCHAEMRGAELGSQFLRFVPTTEVKSSYETFDVSEARQGGSAGATGLVLQTVALPLALASASNSVSTTFRGGTHVPMSPSADYIEYVFLPALREMGVLAKFTVSEAGFFPKGGGEISLSLTSPPNEGIDRTERGKLKRFVAVITTAQLPDHVAERGLAQLQKDLKDYGVPVIPVLKSLPSPGAGAAVLLVAECEKTVEGWQSLGERGKPMERVASDAARDFKKWFATGMGTDRYLADQLVLPSALCSSLCAAPSRWTTSHVSEHLRTVIMVLSLYLPVSLLLTENADGSGLVEVKA